jgi:hypothetical protein
MDATSTLQALPVIDISAFLASDACDPAVQDACRAVADCLRDTGALIVRDPRVNAGDNARFLDMMEAYFSQPHEVKLADVHPELCYQVRALRARTRSLEPQACVLWSTPAASTQFCCRWAPRLSSWRRRGSRCAPLQEYAHDAAASCVAAAAQARCALLGGPCFGARGADAAGGAPSHDAQRTRPQVALFLARRTSTGRRRHALCRVERRAGHTQGMFYHRAHVRPPHRMRQPLHAWSAGLSAVDRGHGLVGPAHDESSDKRC